MQDRGKDGAACPVRDVPTGGGGHPASAVPDDPQADTPLRGNPAEGCADMTSVKHCQSNERSGDGAIGVGLPVEKRHRIRHRTRQAARDGAILLLATQNRLVGSSAGGRIVTQEPGGVAGIGSNGKFPL